MFANHLAIIGNTGSGKSCGVTRILQNLFTESLVKPKKSHFVIFDAYGEYTHAFDGLDINTKVYTAVKETALDLGLTIPPNFLEVDDLAILLGVTEGDQIPVLEKH